MSQIYETKELQQQILFPNNSYYQPNYYIEDESYPNYYEQPNIYDHPKNYSRKLFIRKRPQYENEPMNIAFSEGRSNRRNISRIGYPTFSNVPYRQNDLSHASNFSDNNRIIPNIQSNRIFQKNKYNNSNGSSHESKLLYDIVKDSRSIHRNMNNLSESQKEFFKTLREENRELVKSFREENRELVKIFMDGMAQNLNGFMNRLTNSLNGMTQELTKGMNDFIRKQEENNKKFLTDLSNKFEIQVKKKNKRDLSEKIDFWFNWQLYNHFYFYFLN